MIAVATRTAVEIVAFEPQILRASDMLTALRRGAPRSLDVRVSARYRGASPWLVFWGPGAPERQHVMRQHVAAGGHAIALDLAYWSRISKVRVSIDAAHPQAWILRRDWPATRWHGDPAPLENVWDPNGPVVVAGIGTKAMIQYGDQVDQWEAEIIAACVGRGQRVLYRAKPGKTPPSAAVFALGAERTSNAPIEEILCGASRLVTWHSNVAVDAIRMGIPVVCRDGVAAAVCPSTLDEPAMPLAIETRYRFLQNLAWFQWTPREAPACWRWLQDLLS